MADVLTVQIELANTITGQPTVRVQNAETLQFPGPVGPASAELVVAAIDRLAEDVADRAKEQARQVLRQVP
jgi:hypothetical protein